ncbi:MAG: hypothetical protein APR53_00220 [Methanoculleus sp. SDB]|nr:MAG: hypothetical protein APR53_00220 [Methanoculleus sp. SDB]
MVLNDDDRIYRVLERTIIVAMVLGMALTAFLLFFNTETYSALYLAPDSYSNYAPEGTVSFVYAVISSESGTMAYSASISLGDTTVDKREFILGGGERWEEEITIPLPPQTAFPVKVSVLLTKENGRTEEVHFWLKGWTI